MRIFKMKDYDGLSRRAANMISAQVLLKPNCVLSLATGETPIGAYKILGDIYEKGGIDLAEVKVVALDEYKGLGKTDPNSYQQYLKQHLLGHTNLNEDRIFAPDGLENDPDKACSDYNKLLWSIGKVDMCVLGLGLNGHIGFNEPDLFFEKGTFCVTLNELTVNANVRLFGEGETPKEAYTVGVGNILDARRIVLLVSGKAKAEALREALFGPINPAVPGSILQLHRNVTVIADEDALSKCEDKLIGNPPAVYFSEQ